MKILSRRVLGGHAEPTLALVAVQEVDGLPGLRARGTLVPVGNLKPLLAAHAGMGTFRPDAPLADVGD